MSADGKVRFRCPHCDKAVSISAQHVGKRGKCPGCGTVVLIPKVESEYVQECFDSRIVEAVDATHWSQLPGAREIAQAGNKKDWPTTGRLAVEFLKKQPHNGFAHFWVANAHMGLKQHDRARASLKQALSHATNKYMLCVLYGDLEREAGDIDEAVKWWIRSSMLQMRAQHLREHSPFLYLSYVAEALDLDNACFALRQKVDAIQSGEIRLDADPATKLVADTRLFANPDVRQAIERMAAECGAGDGGEPSQSVRDAVLVERVARLVGYLRPFRKQSDAVNQQPEFLELRQIGEFLDAKGGYGLMSKIAEAMASRVTTPPNPWVGDQVRDSMSDISEYWSGIGALR